jgi:hypothetical protein
MRPTDETGFEGALVVVVAAGDVVVVVGATVVVEDVPPGVAEVDVTGGVAEVVVVVGNRRLRTPEYLRPPALEPAFLTTSVRVEVESRLPTVDAEASIVTIATSRLDEIASVANF